MKKIILLIFLTLVVSNSYSYYNVFDISNYNIFGNIMTIINNSGIPNYISHYKKFHNTNNNNRLITNKDYRQQEHKKYDSKIIKQHKTIDNKKKKTKQLTKKVILQKVITLAEVINKKDLCQYIYNVKNIDKMVDYRDFNKRANLEQKQFIFLDRRVKRFLPQCYKLFSLNTIDKKIIKSRIIFFREDSNIPYGLSSKIKYNTYKKYLIKNKIWLTPVYDHGYQVKEAYNHNLYNLFYKRIFPIYYLDKDFIILNYKDYKNYKVFRMGLEKIISNYMKVRKQFYIKNKIYQDTNPRTGYKNHDREKCGIYSLTEIITFNNYLSNILFTLSKGNEFNIKNLNKVINQYTKKIANNIIYDRKLFNKLSIVYVKDFRKKNGVGVSELDLIGYLNRFLDGFSNKNKTIYIKYKYLSGLTNPYLNDLSISIDIKIRGRRVKGGHFGLRLCDVNNKCIQYWPDKGYIPDMYYRQFYGKKRVVEYGINFSMVGNYKLYTN